MTNPLQGLNFQTLFDAVSDAMLLVDDTGHIVQANSAAYLLLGYAEAEIIGLAVEALMPQQYRDHHHHYREAFNKKPEKRSMGTGTGAALVALCRDGKEIEVDIGLSPMPSTEQPYTLVTFYVADQRRQAEEELRISEERLALAKQAAHLSVFDFDAHYNVLYWDDCLRALWGAEPDSVMNYQRIISAVHPNDREAFQAAFEHANSPAGNGEYSIECRVINPIDHTERWIAAAGHMHFKNEVANRLVGIAQDITEQKIIEKQLQKQRTEVEANFTQQVAAQTASAIAHELNQPLAAISAYSEVALHALENDSFDPNSLKRALEGSVKQAQRAGSSLHELLAFLQKGDVVRDKLNINDIVKEALIIAKSNGYGEFYPILQLEDNMPLVLGNRIQVLKILVNLLTNSVEAMHGVGMSTSTITITVRTNADINMAHVTVRDNGPGLDPETAKRIFEPFFTTKPTGIGMGLAISRALAEANGGQLWLEPGNKPNAMFHFALPFAV